MVMVRLHIDGVLAFANIDSVLVIDDVVVSLLTCPGASLIAGFPPVAGNVTWMVTVNIGRKFSVVNAD